MSGISNFVFNHTASQQFGLVIANLNGNAISEKNTYGNVEPLLDSAGNRPLPYHYGVSRPKNLTFPLEIYNKHGCWYEQFEVQAIEGWLFGHKSPKLLSIFDPDKGNESYECWLTNENQIVKLDKRVVGWKFEVVCASPYTLGDKTEREFDCTSGMTVFEYFNLSNIKDFIYPEMVIALSPQTVAVRIDSQNEPNRPFVVTGVRPGETINVNNALGTIETASGDRVLDKFNLNFFRLTDGFNKFTVNGSCMITIKTRIYKTASAY